MLVVSLYFHREYSLFLGSNHKKIMKVASIIRENHANNESGLNKSRLSIKSTQAHEARVQRIVTPFRQKKSLSFISENKPVSVNIDQEEPNNKASKVPSSSKRNQSHKIISPSLMKPPLPASKMKKTEGNAKSSKELTQEYFKGGHPRVKITQETSKASLKAKEEGPNLQGSLLTQKKDRLGTISLPFKKEIRKKPPIDFWFKAL